MKDSINAYPKLTSFLRQQGFLVLCCNEHDPSEHGPFEAWAYHGPLSFDRASPETFGVGKTSQEALQALESLLSGRSREVNLVHPGLQRIYNALYLDTVDSRECYNPDKEWSADTLSGIAEVMAEYLPPPTFVSDVPPNSRTSAGDGAESTVTITIRGGVAELAAKPWGVSVVIVDYDVEGEDPAKLDKDSEGKPCCMREWPTDATIGPLNQET